MPPITATLVDLLTYLAPGFVVLYGLRRQSDSLERLFDAIPSSHGTSALLMLSITAMAFGLMVSGISMLLIPWLSRLTTMNKEAPLHLRQLDLLRLYTRPPETLQVFQHHTRIYQSYANMATALVVSLAILAYNLWDKQPIDHWEFKLVSYSIFALLMLLASVRYFKVVYRIGHSLSQSAEPVGDVRDATNGAPLMRSANSGNTLFGCSFQK